LRQQQAHLEAEAGLGGRAPRRRNRSGAAGDNQGQLLLHGGVQSVLLGLKGQTPMITSRLLRTQGSICRQLLQKGDRRLQGRHCRGRPCQLLRGGGQRSGRCGTRRRVVRTLACAADGRSRQGRQQRAQQAEVAAQRQAGVAAAAAAGACRNQEQLHALQPLRVVQLLQLPLLLGAAEQQGGQGGSHRAVVAGRSRRRRSLQHTVQPQRLLLVANSRSADGAVAGAVWQGQGRASLCKSKRKRGGLGPNCSQA
jgi:hypothetical protein